MEKSRLLYQLDTPFSNIAWPRIGQQEQDEVLDLLCNVLSPIGQHRKSYLEPSQQGRQTKVRKRRRSRDDGESRLQRIAPPPPAVALSVDIGLRSITRTLEAYSSSMATGAGNGDDSPKAAPYAVIFVARLAPPSAFFSHFPQMVAVASRSRQLPEPIRLVGFSKSCEERLGACLGVPRLSSIALRCTELAQAKALVDFVRARVPPVEALWLDEALQGTFHETKINAIQVAVGQKRQRKGRLL